MGSICSTQGSASLSSARRNSRLGIAALVAMVVTFLAAAPAMAASEVEVGSNSALTYKAAPGQSNQITISGDDLSLTVTDRGTDSISILSPSCSPDPVDPQVVTCTGANHIIVFARDLDDTVTLSTGLTSLIQGQNGSDLLNGGSGADVIRGGEGDDALNGYAGEDYLFGEDIPTQIGDDLLSGGDGLDWVNYTNMPGVTVDLGNTGIQDTGAGLDTLTGLENVNGSTNGDDLTGNASPNKFVGSGGDDVFHIASADSDVVNCGEGSDTVFPDRSDVVRYRNHTLEGTTCETVDDNAVPGNTEITDGPSGLTNNPRWQFTSNEPWADFQCAVVANLGDLVPESWSACSSGQPVTVPGDGSWILAVRAVDDQNNRDPQDPPATRSFTLDTTAPQTDVQGPSGTTSNPAPEFSVSSPDDPGATFNCGFDREAFFECSTPVSPNPALADGDHFLEVVAIDAAGNRDATPARVNFRVDTRGVGPGPGDGPLPNPQKPQVQQAKIIIGSLVLISGSAVKMSRKGRISISLTCAGAAKCSGRLSITTAEPVSKRNRQLVTLGAKKFTIGGNQKRKVNVKFSKRNIRLAKRLKRFKAKAVIREIDARGNPRLSSRLFILRAR